MEKKLRKWQAIAHDDSANGFSGWVEFEEENEQKAWDHAENLLGTFKFKLEDITDED